jgi:3-(3-hydroxy-phenyl)propionate hydroxylase
MSAAAEHIWRQMDTTPCPGGDASVPVVVIGAGPVGLTLALDLGRRGHTVLVLNRNSHIASGSKAICFAKRSLDTFDQLGVGDAMMEKGVLWNVGKVFWGDRPKPVYEFDLLPIKSQKRPAFINIQQYHVEERLVDALNVLPRVELRWGHEAVALRQQHDGMMITVACGASRYTVRAQYVVACDGCHSPTRNLLGLDFKGRVFNDRFLIADIKLRSSRPPERWFWFEPPFNGARSALLHKQPDDVWRLDFQLGPAAEIPATLDPAVVERYVRALLGPGVDFEKEWYSVYTFQCRRMERFVHGRVLFAGDSAHLVSPFGARGCNSGIADAANLGWKLDLVLQGRADHRLLESYDREAVLAADENIRQSSRSTDFMTPRSAAHRALRDAVLELAQVYSFARPFVNSGRLSIPVCYVDSPLNTPDSDVWEGGLPPGSVALDAPVGDTWLLDRLPPRFTLLADGCRYPIDREVHLIDIASERGDTSMLRQRYALTSGTAYLLRPDHYIAARWRAPTSEVLAMALARARGLLT